MLLLPQEFSILQPASSGWHSGDKIKICPLDSTSSCRACSVPFSYIFRKGPCKNYFEKGALQELFWERGPARTCWVQRTYLNLVPKMPSRTGRLLRARVNSILDGIQMTGYKQTYILKFFLLYNWMSYLLKEFGNLNGNPLTIAECVKTQLRTSLMAKGYFIFGIRHRSYWALIYTTIIYLYYY